MKGNSYFLKVWHYTKLFEELYLALYDLRLNHKLCLSFFMFWKFTFISCLVFAKSGIFCCVCVCGGGELWPFINKHNTKKWFKKKIINFENRLSYFIHFDYSYMFAKFQVIWSKNVVQDRVWNFTTFTEKLQNSSVAMQPCGKYRRISSFLTFLTMLSLIAVVKSS